MTVETSQPVAGKHDQLGEHDTGGKIILRFPGRLPEDGEFDDVADEYAIVQSETAMCGLVIYARYGERWEPNPWNERPVVRELLTRLKNASPVAGTPQKA